MKNKEVTPAQAGLIVGMTILGVALLALFFAMVDESRPETNQPVQIQCAADTVIQPDGSCMPQER